MQYEWSKYKGLQWPGAAKLESPKGASSNLRHRGWVGIKETMCEVWLSVVVF